MDEHSPVQEDSLSPLVAERLSGLMAERGVPFRQQAGVLSQLCGLSISQARRKLRGAVWSFGEVLAVARHYGVSLDGLFSAAAVNAEQGMQPARFVTDEWEGPCQVRLGAQIRAGEPTADLVVAGNAEGWYVGTRQQLERRAVGGLRYRAEQVVLTPPCRVPTRIAVLDDEIGTSELLCECFHAMGYAATPFGSAKDFLAVPRQSHDVFVIDFVLAGGESSQAIIEEIRRALPEAPILLLTGKLRDGQASEATLATVLRTSNVRFFEKPVRPAVLAAAIESCLDQATERRPA